jgi:ABC-2 type transport system permease protein
MKLRRIQAVARKEFLHVLRDVRSLGMAIAIPLLMLVMFGYALTLDVDRVPLLVWDQSGTQASRDLVGLFTGSRYFQLRGYADNYRDIEQAIDEGRAMVALVVPREFAAGVTTNRRQQVQVLVDASDSNTATIALGYANSIVQSYAQGLALEYIQRTGGRTVEMPLDVRPRVWFNADMQSKNFIVPGLIAVIMMVIAAMLTSLTIAREWERGTMEQLVSTPVTGPELVVGKLLPYFAIGMFDMLLAVLMGEFLFHVPFRGSLLLLTAVASVFLAGVLAMGILISIVTKNQLLASQLAMTLTFLPAFLLSGLMIPIHNMPTAIQWMTHIVPARYFVTLLRGIYLKGVGVDVLGGEIVLLSAFGVVMVLLAVAKFKKRLT